MEAIRKGKDLKSVGEVFSSLFDDTNCVPQDQQFIKPTVLNDSTTTL